MITALYLLLISNKMTLLSMVACIGLDAVLLTLLVGFLKKQKSLLMTYFQNFCGALFIFSGWVKAIDPLGTAYKLEQYFAEFESTFADTWMSFLSPMFPWLSEYSVGFSVFMIVLEIVLGIMLIIGSRRKLTSWLFLIIVAFFTFLTGAFLALVAFLVVFLALVTFFATFFLAGAFFFLVALVVVFFFF